MKEAEALLYDMEKKAEGMKKIYDAELEGIKNLLKNFEDDESLLEFLFSGNIYFNEERKTMEIIAKETANAIRALKPNVSVWNISDLGNSGKQELELAMKSIPPALYLFSEEVQKLSDEDILNIAEDFLDKKAEVSV
jgi:hypothetical protein